MKKRNVMLIIISEIIGIVAGGIATGKKLKQTVKETQDKERKMSSYYHLFNKWLIIQQQGKSVVDFFEQNHYKSIAIYGMKEFGERLYDELKSSDITVKYVIDKNIDGIYTDIDVVTPDDKLRPVDVIVVTAIYYFDEIEEMLYKKVNFPIVSLEDVLYEI